MHPAYPRDTRPKYGCIFQHSKIAFPQIRRPLCGLFLMWRIAEKHQVLVGGFPQTIDDFGCVKTYAAVAGGQKLCHTALAQRHNLLRQFDFHFPAATIFFIKPPWKAHGCLPYDCTTVYTAAFFQSSHTLTKIIVAINNTTIIIKMQRFSKV